LTNTRLWLWLRLPWIASLLGRLADTGFLPGRLRILARCGRWRARRGRLTNTGLLARRRLRIFSSRRSRWRSRRGRLPDRRLLRPRLRGGRRCRPRRRLHLAALRRRRRLLGRTLLDARRRLLRLRRWRLRARRRLHGRLLRRARRLLLRWRGTASLAFFLDPLFALLLGLRRAGRLGEDDRRLGGGRRRRGRARQCAD
jgi:hypothetical protein